MDKTPVEIQEAMDHLASIAIFAYAQGYHELGYDPVAVLTEVLAEYKRDAERYRWLRDKAEFGSHHDPAVANGTCEHLTIFVGEELDRELDAAMDQTEQKR